jgi:hypothetical protein
MTDSAVTVAYIYDDDRGLPHSWHMSLVELIGWDWARHGRVLNGGFLAMNYTASGGLPAARNQTVERFLTERDAEWLWWVDTDMGFAPDTVDCLLEVADPVTRPIVGGLCFAQKEVGDDGLGGRRCEPRPTIFDWVGQGDVGSTFARTTYPVNALVQCVATGSACLLVHRSVFQRIRDTRGPVWYDRLPNPMLGGLFGEDISFCIRAGSLGLPVYVHTGVKTSHWKQLWLQEADYWQWATAPPATAETAVVVPALRHANAERFVDSLRASTGLARAYAVARPDETEAIAAWKAAGADVITDPGCATFAERINAGYRQTAEPWLFVTGDDVRFQPGWLDHAQAVAGASHHVIGTNDLANPRVTAGHHATHMLVRRSYAAERGASWDGPDVVCHEGYRHWWVDDEIVTVAKQRGVWAMALGSRVEHFHPLYGTAEMDEVYELGQSHVEADRALFERRAAEHLGGAK